MKKQLAIKGHRTRGKEVIEILQMLGGGKTVYSGTDTLCIYFLNESGEIISELYREDCSLTSLTYDVYTLEEFLKKFPFKVNDIVVNDNYSCTGIITEMRWDNDNREVKYCVEFENLDTIVWFNHNEIKSNKDELFHEDNKEPLHELCEKLCNNKLSTLIINSEVCDDEVELILDDYEIEVRDGKTYAIKKKSKYPETYEECCGVLGMTYDFPDIRMVSTDEYILYSNFIQLIRCRDAYWKIAGEQMGLDKSWEPEWEKSDSGYVYCIVNKCNNIGLICEWLRNNYILSFPTAEMRDMFYENFKDTIKKCKEFL
jgi:hypothetical protein